MLLALFRVDGGIGIGDGHLSRTLALAAALSDRGWHCELLTSDLSATGAVRWCEAGFSCRELTATRGGAEDGHETAGALFELAATTVTPPWLVLDGYHFTHAMWEPLTQLEPCRRLAFDDVAVPHTPPVAAPLDVLVNQNAGADTRYADAYPNAARPLLGTHYAALRPEIQCARDMPSRGAGVPCDLLISLGGSVPPELSLEVVSTVLANRPGTAITVVAAARPIGLPSSELPPEVDWRGPMDIAPLLASARVAVIGGGVTSLEAAYLGIPSAVLVIADNQRPGAETLAVAGICMIARGGAEAGKLAAALLVDDAARYQMRAAGQRLVDGHGPRRIAEVMNAAMD